MYPDRKLNLNDETADTVYFVTVKYDLSALGLLNSVELWGSDL
jgi:hypothetical protein